MLGERTLHEIAGNIPDEAVDIGLCKQCMCQIIHGVKSDEAKQPVMAAACLVGGHGSGGKEHHQKGKDLDNYRLHRQGRTVNLPGNKTGRCNQTDEQSSGHEVAGVPTKNAEEHKGASAQKKRRTVTQLRRQSGAL